jgi:hypothetical protein
VSSSSILSFFNATKLLISVERSKDLKFKNEFLCTNHSADKGSYAYQIDVFLNDVLDLRRNSSIEDIDAVDIIDVASGYLTGHVGGRELSEGLAHLLDDLIVGIDYTMTVVAIQQYSFMYPHSRIGYPISVKLQFLLDLSSVKKISLLNCLFDAMTEVKKET